MKTKDIPIFKQKVLDMLPVTQAEVWKKLKIDSRSGSELINMMLKESLIERTRHDKTFMIERKNGSGPKKTKKDCSALLSKNGKFSPCCGCIIDCDPVKCVLLSEWL